MILLSELSRRRIRWIQKLIRVGRNEVVVVLRVDKEKGASLSPHASSLRQLISFTSPISPCSHIGYIDLSKRRVSPEDITKCEERYMKSKTVASIMRHVASKIPSVNGEVLEGEQAKQAEAEAAETKRARRAAKREGHEDDLVAAAAEGPGMDANEEARLEQLYEQIAWPLGRKYGHPYDAFKLALT